MYLQYTPTRPKSYFSPIWCSRPAWSPTRLPDGQWSKQACWETLFWTWGTALGRKSGVGSKSGRDRSVDFSLAQILIFNRYRTFRGPSYPLSSRGRIRFSRGRIRPACVGRTKFSYPSTRVPVPVPTNTGYRVCQNAI